MSKQATFVVFTKKQIENIIIDQTQFGAGKVQFLYAQNKLSGCVVVKHPIEENVTDFGIIYTVAEFNRAEIDKMLLEYKKQEGNSRATVNYYPRGTIDPSNSTAEHLFDVAVVRYGEVELDQTVLKELSIIAPQIT